MKTIKVLGICGSLRKDSFNLKALKIALDHATKSKAEVRQLDLKKLALPIYDKDIEDKAFPGSATQAKKLVEQSDLLLIATPEYNNSISAALKNLIDWLSRDGNSLSGKSVAIFGASSGGFGTVLGQEHLRLVLGKLGVHVLPTPRIFISNSEDAFDSSDKFIDEKNNKKLQNLVNAALDFAAKLK